MKILFITRKWSPAIGGMETYSIELCRALKEQGVNLTVRNLPGQNNGKPPKIFALLSFLITSIYYLFRHRKDYDAIHFGDFVLFPLAWVHSKFYPDGKRVITVHGLDIIYGNRKGLSPFIYSRFIKWCQRRINAVDMIITNSHNTSHLVDKMGLGKSIAIPLGVRLKNKDFHPADKNKYILFVGRLVKRKGAAWFVSNILPKLPYGIILKVVGKVWDADEEKVLCQSKQVEMLGFIEDSELEYLKKRASIIIMPNIPSQGDTDVEGFGLVALEASASGSPLIASNIEGIADAVITGQSGFLVKTLDVTDWLKQINKILEWSDDERESFAKNAFTSLQNHFSWERVAKETKNVYSSLN